MRVKYSALIKKGFHSRQHETVTQSLTSENLKNNKECRKKLRVKFKKSF